MKVTGTGPNGWPISFEEGCAILGIKVVRPGIDGISPKHARHVIDDYELVIIAEAINHLIEEPTGKFPDWNNREQRKWEAWWKLIKANKKNPGGVGFSNSYYDDTFTSSFVGSRFCMKTKEACVYLYESQYFEKLWINQLLIAKE